MSVNTKTRCLEGSGSSDSLPRFCAWPVDMTLAVCGTLERSGTAGTRSSKLQMLVKLYCAATPCFVVCCLHPGHRDALLVAGQLPVAAILVAGDNAPTPLNGASAFLCWEADEARMAFEPRKAFAPSSGHLHIARRRSPGLSVGLRGLPRPRGSQFPVFGICRLYVLFMPRWPA